MYVKKKTNKNDKNYYLAKTKISENIKIKYEQKL